MPVPSLLRWLSLRIRLLCSVVFVLGALLPPYVPKSAQAFDEIPVTSSQFLFVEEGFLMKSSSLGVQGQRLAYSEGLIHRVKDGESMQVIARKYGVSIQTIQWANGFEQGEGIQPNQEIIILPVDGMLHTVRRGQTLARIAQLYDIPQEEIARQNKVRGGFIIAGQQLIIPNGKPLLGGEGGAIAAAGESLRFAEKLNGKDIKLKLSVPVPPVAAKAVAGKKSVGPAVGVAVTQSVLQMPCGNCFYTQYFNPSHYAVDIQERGGGPIYSAEAGTIIRAEGGWNGGYGNVVEIDHGNGLVTLYAHNKELYVKKGDAVKRGQNISFMGNTGLVHGPTGIHVHFEVRVNGVKKNPLLYLD